MAIFAYMFAGLVVGILVRVALPPTRLVGLWGSALLGLVGGVLGGIFSSIVGPHTTLAQVHPLGIALAVVFAALIAVGVTLVTRRRAFW